MGLIRKDGTLKGSHASVKLDGEWKNHKAAGWVVSWSPEGYGFNFNVFVDDETGFEVSVSKKALLRILAQIEERENAGTE